MANTVAKYPGTVSETNAYSPYDDHDWVNENNVKVDDANYAECTTANFGTYYAYLLTCQNFGFSIPDGATIDGVYVEIKFSEDDALANIYSRYLMLLDADGEPIGDVKEITGEASTTPTEEEAGGEADDWGLGASLTEALVENTNFGVGLSFRSQGSSTPKGRCFFVRMTIYYTETAGWTNIAKVSGVTATDLAKVDGIAVANITKVCGVAV